MSGKSKVKYNKYDKGKFVKPISRKKKVQEKLEHEQRVKQTRINIEKWIEALPDYDSSLSNQNRYIEVDSGTEFANSTEGESTASTLNKGFYAQKECTNFQSLVKCDVSVENLLPHRLRERNKSGVYLSGVNKDKVSVKLFDQSTTPTSEDKREVKGGVNCNWQEETEGVKVKSDNKACEKDNLTDKDEEDCNSVSSVFNSCTDSTNMLLFEVRFKCPANVDVKQFETMNQSEKMGKILSTLNGLCDKLSELDIQTNHDTDSIATKVEVLQTQVDTDAASVAKLQKENGVLKGIVQRQFHQIKDLNDKVTNLMARSMQKNLSISGIMGDSTKEKLAEAKEKILEFFKQKVEIDVDTTEILVAHRVGNYRKNQKKPRLMLVRCMPALKERVLDNVSNLKEKENEDGDPYYINKQLPEKLMEQNREIRQTIKEIKSKEESLLAREKSKIEVQNKVVYLDGVPQTKELLPPEPMELFPDDAEADKIGKIELAASDLVSEKRSDFQAFAFKTSQFLEVQRAYRKVRMLQPAATHVIGVFNLRNKQGFQDDDKHASGYRILRAMQEQNMNNIAVFIAHTYGGVKLGVQRHYTD